MPINIGDAILQFLADTTQLDQAFDKVESEAQEKLKPVQQEIGKVGTALDGAGKAAEGLAKDLGTAGTAGKAAGEAAASGVAEVGVAAAEAEVGLAGMAVAAGATALAVSAIPFVMAAIVGYAKEAWLNFTGWGDAERDAYEVMLQINAEIINFNRTLEVQKAHLSEIGLSGSARLAEYVKNLKEADLAKANEALGVATNKVKDLQNQLTGTHKETWVDELGGTLKIDVPNAAGKSRKEIEELTNKLSDAQKESAKLAENVRKLSEVTIPGAEKEQNVAEIEEGRRASEQAEGDRRRQIAETTRAWAQGLQERKDAQDGFHQLSKQDEANYWAGILLTTRAGTEEAKFAYHQMRLAQQEADRQALGEEVRGVQLQVAAAQSGSQQRIDLIEAEMRKMRSAGQQETAEYKRMEMDLTRAKKEQDDARTREQQKGDRIRRQLAAEESRFKIASARLEIQADQEYYQQLYENGQIGYEQLLALTEVSINRRYDLERDALLKRLNELGQDEVLERKRVLDALALLDIDHNNRLLQLKEEERQAIEKVDFAIQRGMTLEQKWFALWSSQGPKMRQIFKQISDIGKQTFLDLVRAQGQAVAAFVLGGESLGKAMRRATAQVLAQVAGQAFVLALFETAKGIAALAMHDYEGAGLHFKAAGMFGATAALAGAAAAAINPGNDQSSSAQGGGSGSQPQDTGAQANGPAPVTRNVHRFGAGAVVTGPTLAVVGDARGSANIRGATEAILPLEDPEAMSKIAEALTAAGFGYIQNNYIEGVISADNLDSVMGQMSKRVRDNDVQLVASVSHRVIRKS